MKKIFSIVFACMALMTVVGCSDASYDEKYADPSKTSTVGVPQVFTAILMKGNTWMNPVYYRWYVQSSTSGVFSGVIGQANGKGRFQGAGESYFNVRWQNFYDMVTQLRVLECTYNDLTPEQQTANELFLHLGRVVVDAQLHEMLSLFGDVPFSGAGYLWKTSNYDETKEEDVYDDDVTLYGKILEDLKSAGDFLSGSVSSSAITSLKAQDFTTAAGDVDLWRRYVNSLRLRIALHLATNGDCVSAAKSAIAELLGSPEKYPLIETNAQNMGVNGDTSTDTFYFGKGTAQALAGRSESVCSQNMLNAMNVPSTGKPDANTDPRLPLMYDCNPDGDYIAYDLTMSSTEIDKLSTDKTNEYLKKYGKNANYFCYMDTIAIAGWKEYQGNANLNGIWMGAAEVALSKAEAYTMGYGVSANLETAKNAFIQGVVLSTEYYRNMKLNSSLADQSDNDSYSAYRQLIVPTDDDAKAYAQKVWDGTQKCVATQLWINHAYMNELEAWNVVRRTGYPTIEFASDKLVSSYANPPQRLPYPSDEINYNNDNYQKAKSLNYGSDETGYYNKLFWAVNDYYKIIANQ